MRTKAQFIREWMQSEAVADSDKSWSGTEFGKEFSGAPSFFIFVDMDYFALMSQVAWIPPLYQRQGIVVPKGFVTDFASIPRAFWSLLPPIGRYGYPALFHDYVYWDQTLKRVEADAVFRDTMVELTVPAWKRSILFYAVRIFGFAAWRHNAKLKARGEKRVLKMFPSDLRVSWLEWKREPGVFS
jgi:hypothetical protein